MTVAKHDLQAELLEQFGVDTFRRGRKRIIRTRLGQRDVLAALPTGSVATPVMRLGSQLCCDA